MSRRRGAGPHNRDFLFRLMQLPQDDGLVMYNAACSFSVLGEIERSIQCLRRAAQLGYKNTQEWIKFDPDLEPVRKHPAYQSIIEAFG